MQNGMENIANANKSLITKASFNFGLKYKKRNIFEDNLLLWFITCSGVEEFTTELMINQQKSFDNSDNELNHPLQAPAFIIYIYNIKDKHVFELNECTGIPLSTNNLLFVHQKSQNK